MSIKLPIAAVALATIITLAHSAIAGAEVYKTQKNQVVVTGLTAKQKYDIQAVNAKNKPKKRNLTANTCGELLIDGAAKYKSLVVGTETIDPTTLIIKEHPRCKVKKIKIVKSTQQTNSATRTIIPSMAPSPK